MRRRLLTIATDRLPATTHLILAPYLNNWWNASEYPSSN